jgi:hypothetical protein
MENLKALIDSYVDAIQKGELEFDQIRKSLESKSIPEKDIRYIVREVDDRILEENTKPIRSKKDLKFDNGIGVLVSLAGIILFFLTRFGIIELDENQYWSYTVLLGGLSLLFLKWVKKRSNKFTNRNKFK